jgi:protein-S-isoprenylcysteine O-methyltransferase Ste14
MWFRHFIAIAVLPFTAAILIPVLIARRNATPLAVGPSSSAVLIQIAGLALLAVGLRLFVESLRRFATDGKGKLAPRDPPRALVVRGPYRFVRNPMISGVVFALFGEALALRSMPHAGWAAAFLAANLVYIPLLEEPMLESRFGEPYREYCRNVPRIFPRLRPWEPEPD